jgi:non-ribosomal peptide synthetase component F
VVVRLDVTAERGFTDLLAQARQVTAEAHEHKDLPFADLVRELVPHPDPAHSPLFQVMFNLVPMPRLTADGGDGSADDGLDIAQVDADPGPAKYDLNLTVRETDSGLLGHLEYSTDLFTGETATRMARAYERLLAEIAADPGADLARLRARTDRTSTDETA